MNITSQTNMLPDRRRMRAQAISHYVLHALEPYIDRLERLQDWEERERIAAGGPSGHPKTRRDIANTLFDLFFATGAEVITDADRASAGLEPRNERGLTETELMIIEERMRDVMLRPVQIIPKATP